MVRSAALDALGLLTDDIISCGFIPPIRARASPSSLHALSWATLCHIRSLLRIGNAVDVPLLQLQRGHLLPPVCSL